MSEENSHGLTDRQRRFAELLVQGTAAGRAYEAAGYAARGDAADACASRLLGNAKVAAYLGHLRKQAEAKAEFSRDDLIGFLVQVIRTPISKIDAESPLAQELKISDDGTTLKMPNKLGAAKQLAEVLGWNKPQEVKVDLSEQLADIIGRVRKS